MNDTSVAGSQGAASSTIQAKSHDSAEGEDDEFRDPEQAAGGFRRDSASVVLRQGQLSLPDHFSVSPEEKRGHLERIERRCAQKYHLHQGGDIHDIRESLLRISESLGAPAAAAAADDDDSVSAEVQSHSAVSTSAATTSNTLTATQERRAHLEPVKDVWKAFLCM